MSNTKDKAKAIENHQKWWGMPRELRKKLVENVWCVHCRDVVTIVNYEVEADKFGVVLQGKCKTCGYDVARLIEME
ncbi:hypothetical protein H1S01_17380 [Heliobacterium chlorum]|uniref:Uncharacterized protein n=1 Tax=Heliobacterium chlorum TaxID=2698 RepID=A0ABR7T8U9_HELCL|nr:hypothetical protein [Heliobacterium chlorum]MBC9786236.1 hypothetical protein [Heliobacterium chlorum]